MPLVWDRPRRAWQRCFLWTGSRGARRSDNRPTRADRRLALEPLEDRQLLSVTPSILADVRVGATGSNPSQFVSTLNTTFFVADNGVTGPELWHTDGTQPGTALVKDIRPGSLGSVPRWLASSGNLLYFVANDGTSGDELWRSDGTAVGTYRVKDIRPGSTGSSPAELVDLNGTLYFLANDGINGSELWKSNGTAAGTVMVKDIAPGAAASLGSSLTAFGDRLYFAADDGAHGTELWISDGTPGGTMMLKDIAAGATNSYPFYFTPLAGDLYFTAENASNGAELWKTDGTPAGTVMVKDVYLGEFSGDPYALTAVGNRLFFLAEDGIHGNELWMSDGTEDGTVLVRDINEKLVFPGNPDSPTLDSNADWLTNVGGVLYFQADNGIDGPELWRSNGTPGGTTLVADIRPGATGSEPSQLVEMFNTLYFVANDGTHGNELYLAGSSGPQILADINHGSASSNPEHLVAINGTLYFAANNGTQGHEPWLTRPFELQLSNHLVDENAASGTLIGTLVANPGSGDTFTYELYPGPTSGDNGSFRITGDQLYSNAVFDYETKDLYWVGVKATSTGTGLSFWIYEPIQVVDRNDAPVAANDLYSNLAGQTLVVGDPLQGVLRNDLDQDGDPFQAIWVSGPSHGAVVLNADGTFTYTPTPGYLGRDSFTYKIKELGGDQEESNTATVTINARPVAAADFYQVNEDALLSVPASGVLANDVDYDDGALSAQLASAPAHAAVGGFTLNADGSFVYRPAADFFGVDTFTYTANDPHSASLPVTVQITVVGLPDTPQAHDDFYGPLVGNEVLTVPARGVQDNDYNPDNADLTSVLIGTPPPGLLQLAANGGFTYTPPEAFDGGTVSFDYRLSDPAGRSDTARVTIQYQPTTQALGIDIIPTAAWEGSGTLAGQGLLTLPAWPRPLVVELSASDPRVWVPPTLTIPAGQTSRGFDLVMMDDSVVGHNLPVTVTATARGLFGDSDALVVHDNDANRFDVGLVNPPYPPYYAGLDFPITAVAYNLDNEVIANYSQTVPVRATSDAGTIAVAVNGSAAGVPFSAGTASANAAVLGLGTNVRLVVDAGGGHIGQSDPPFVVTHGPLASFRFSSDPDGLEPLPSRQPANTAFPVTITATDARGYPVLNYSGPGHAVQLSGWVASGAAPTVVVTEASDQTPDYFEIQNVSGSAVDVQGWKVVLNDALLGDVNAVHASRPLTSLGTLAAGEIRYWTDSQSDSYFGEGINWGSGVAKGWVMILDDSGAIRDFAAWGYSAADIQNMAPVVDGTIVRVGNAWRGAGVTYAGAGGLSLQRIGGHDSNAAGDFLWQGQTKGVNNSLLARPFAAGTGVSITPTASGMFLGGRWTGTVVVQEPARQMYLWCVDENLLPAFSTTFDVTSESTGSGIGAYDPSTSTFYLRATNNSGYADYMFGYGEPGAGWLPIAGDFNGDGIDTVGLYDPQTAQFYLSNSNQTGIAEMIIGYGPGNNMALPVAGDWDGDGVDTIGIYDKTTSLFYLRNSNTSGFADLLIGYGEPGAGWIPTSGDWDGDGRDAVALYAPKTSYIYIKDTLGTGYADYMFGYGEPGAGWLPFAGDWAGMGKDGPGVYDPNNAFYHERFSCTPGVADLMFPYGGTHWLPLAGDWNGPSLLSAPQVAAAQADPIAAQQLQPILAAAFQRWSDAGLPAASLERLQGVELRLADLPGAQLGRTEGRRISIDSNAAGYGWFVDDTPEDDREYSADPSGRLRAVDPGAADRVDLLTVVLHELGHAAGLDDEGPAAETLMGATLSPGLRRTPGPAELDALFGDPGQNWL